MLELLVPITPELWDEVNEVFIEPTYVRLQLEHSLDSLATWESKWNKAFLGKQEKTAEESLDYIRCMTLTPNVDPDVYNHLTEENIKQIQDYIQAPMSATFFGDNQKENRPSREIVTAEVIEYWMVVLNIPSDKRYCHLNRLIALVRVCDLKNSPNKKRMSPQEIMRRNSELNEQRLKRLNTTG